MQGKNILLIITGGIAAYKSLDLIRRLRERGAAVTGVLTPGGAQFITPLAVSGLTGRATYTDLFSLKDETEMGHIRLSREADLIVIAPASADFIAKMVHGRADGLAEAALLAADKPILFCPAMNAQMWANAATRDNVAALESRGLYRLGPGSGDLACGEVGEGRLVEVEEIANWCENFFARRESLKGLKALVTSGATREALDGVRFLSNRSSGKQGRAIAAELALAGAETYYVSAANDTAPPGCTLIAVETARQMLDEVQKILPADIAICAAAVSDWMVVSPESGKIKKKPDQKNWAPELTQTPDILAAISNAGNKRPQLVIGFAAEAENKLENARAKLASKGCDWLIANDIAVIGKNDNEITLLTKSGAEPWPKMPKDKVAQKLVEKIGQQVHKLSS